MRIVIDLQGAQASNAKRGIGRYSLLLTQAMAKHRGENEILVVLNGLLPESIEPIRAALEGQLPQQNIRIWHPIGPVGHLDPDNSERRKAAELTREAFLASLRPDVVHITSLFEGYADDAVTSIGLFAHGIPTVVTLHGDFRMDEHENSSMQAFTLRKLEFLKRADLCHFPSDVSCDGLIEQLGLRHDQILHPPAPASAGLSSEEISGEAQRLISALEERFKPGYSLQEARCPRRRPKLAYISPLPPERSGIADYSAELLPALAYHYDIDVIVAQPEMSDPWVKANCAIRSVEWFSRHSHHFDRVLYHFGNNPMHLQMFDLLDRIPGIVVLHDFFLSGIQWYREAHQYAPHALSRELYKAHGYKAVQTRFLTNDSNATFTYPCNFGVLKKAIGVIAHSPYSTRLAMDWYGDASDWDVIPLLRNPVGKLDRAAVRRKLGIKADDFIVCAFGFLGPTKQNHRLVESWLSSGLSRDAGCKLIFVGQNDTDKYGKDMKKAIEAKSAGGRIEISGWTDAETYRDYLAVADVAVQLRTLSRGETSAAVLDCMNWGIATIVNANGSMAYLPRDAVWMLDDEFQNAQLSDALESLWQDSDRRKALGDRAHEEVRTHHAPRICADQYAVSIERFYEKAEANVHALVQALAGFDNLVSSPAALAILSNSIAQNFPEKKPANRLFVDVSVVCRNDFKTGIQRVVRALVIELINSPPTGYLVEPVYLSDLGGRWHYRHARKYTLDLLQCKSGWIEDEEIEVSVGDTLVGLDLAGSYVIKASKAGLYEQMRNLGLRTYFIVYDLIPIQFDNKYPPGFKEGHATWLESVAKTDGAICISRSVAEELVAWLGTDGPARLRPFKIAWFHLGADVENSAPTLGLPEDCAHVLAQLAARPSFLMVGTLEPRKGHAQTLAAFERLWEEGKQVNLVIVGKNGWLVDELAEKLRHHPELGKRLYWLESISDEYLQKIYAAATCLIAASEGEGFGLPLIEAAQHKLPIVARDIPVFREVAGNNAVYFSGTETDLAKCVKNWLELWQAGQHPKSDAVPWLTWKQSTQQLMDVIIADNWQLEWMPDGEIRHCAQDSPDQNRAPCMSDVEQPTSLSTEGATSNSEATPIPSTSGMGKTVLDALNQVQKPTSSQSRSKSRRKK